VHSTLDKLYGTTFRAFYFSAHQIASSSIARFNQFQFQYGLVLVEKVFLFKHQIRDTFGSLQKYYITKVGTYPVFLRNRETLLVSGKLFQW